MAEYDVVVVGSGFGGSVAALRLVEKGYRVLVLEAGRRFTDQTLPRTSWDVSRFLWAPRLGWLGIQRIHVLPDVVVLAARVSAAGRSTTRTPLPADVRRVLPRPAVVGHHDWRAELAPFYDQASRMLGSSTTRRTPPPTRSCAGPPTTWASGTRSGSPRAAWCSARPARWCPTRSSAARGRRAAAAWSAASA